MSDMDHEERIGELLVELSPYRDATLTVRARPALAVGARAGAAQAFRAPIDPNE
jgi:H+/Cl- antiporter ClcA